MEKSFLKALNKSPINALAEVAELQKAARLFLQDKPYLVLQKKMAKFMDFTSFIQTILDVAVTSVMQAMPSLPMPAENTLVSFS